MTQEQLLFIALIGVKLKNGDDMGEALLAAATEYPAKLEEWNKASTPLWSQEKVGEIEQRSATMEEFLEADAMADDFILGAIERMGASINMTGNFIQLSEHCYMAIDSVQRVHIAQEHIELFSKTPGDIEETIADPPLQAMALHQLGIIDPRINR